MCVFVRARFNECVHAGFFFFSFLQLFVLHARTSSSLGFFFFFFIMCMCPRHVDVMEDLVSRRQLILLAASPAHLKEAAALFIQHQLV